MQLVVQHSAGSYTELTKTQLYPDISDLTDTQSLLAQGGGGGNTIIQGGGGLIDPADDSKNNIATTANPRFWPKRTSSQMWVAQTH